MIWRVVLITAIALLLAYVLVNRNWFFTPLVLGLLLIFFVGNLIYYIEKTNKDLTHFILSIKQGSFTSSFSENTRGKVFDRLSKAFNDVIEEFQKISYEKEMHYQYLQLVTAHINVGIITFDGRGNVQLINPAGLRLLQKQRLTTMTELKSINPRLFEAIEFLQSGERQVLRIIIGDKEFYMSVQAKEITANNEPLKIILLQDLNAELEEQEVDAWQKLIRVLTHEILNSVTPIVSLTHAVNDLLVTKEGERKPLSDLDEEDKNDLYEGLQTIENRSKGLLRFVNAYKDFIKTPELKLTSVDLAGLLQQVLTLLQPEFDRNRIVIDYVSSEQHVVVQADAEWLEQVIINVMKNAMEALENQDKKMIKIETGFQNHHAYLTITDNGTGMDSEMMSKIFIPFFTTKKKGSGIGLSLSKQIMKLHKGSLTVKSEPAKGTSVTLEF